MANKTITQLDAAQSLNDNMVIAVQDTNTTYKTTLADVKAYCGAGGEQIEAVNNTGANISEGDKVWINKEGESVLKDYKDKIYDNFVINGTPVIEDSIIKNFSSTSYITSRSVNLGQANSWEVVSKISALNKTTNQTLLYCPNQFNTALSQTNNGTVWLWLWASDETIYDGEVMKYADLPNDCLIKLAFSGTNYTFSYSINNGLSWTTSWQLTSSKKVENVDSNLIFGSNSFQNSWYGSYDLSQTYIKINDEFFWTPYTFYFNINKFDISTSDISGDNLLSRFFRPMRNNTSYLCIGQNTLGNNYNYSIYTNNSTSWEWKLKFKIGEASTHSRIFCIGDRNISGYMMWCSVSEDNNTSKRIRFGYNYNGSDWADYSFNTELTDFSWYTLQFGCDASLNTLYFKLYDENGALLETINTSETIYFSSTSYINLGLSQTNSDYIPLLYDLLELSFTCNDRNISWKAIPNYIDENTQTGTAAENITIDTTGLVNVGAVIEPTGSITITENGTHDVSDYAEAVVNVASGVDVITAVNNTGSAITSGDKVWINQENGENKLINYYTDTPNYRVNGTLTFDSGGKVVSGFTTTSELQLLDRKKYQTNEINSMEMLFKIHTPTEGNWTSNGRIINSRTADMFDDFALDINQTKPAFSFINADVSNNKMVQVAPANMTSDTDYWIKVTYDGTDLKGFYSLDGENYTLQETVARQSNTLYLKSTYGYSIGNRHMNDGGSHPPCVWNGSIDLFKSYIKINGIYWWTPYVINVTSDTQTGIAAENIAAGGTGLVNVASGV